MKIGERRRVGNTAIHVTKMGFGTTGIGNLYRTVMDEAAQEAIDSAWTAGIRYFDTAPAYGYGLAERRLGLGLLDGRRDECIVSTKVGYVLERANILDVGDELWKGVGSFRTRFDFSRDAVLYSLEESLRRIGSDRIDMVAIHDPDEAASLNSDGSGYTGESMREVMSGAYAALDDLRSEGVVGAVGVGMNGCRMLLEFAELGDFDYFLIAGRYNLLDHSALEELMPLCVARNISVIVGGPYSSGILATGSISGARFNYMSATNEVLDRVRRIENVCQVHGVDLRSAALQFSACHPAVASVIPGAQTVDEVVENVAMFEASIPASFWSELREEGLVSSEAPVPL